MYEIRTDKKWIPKPVAYNMHSFIVMFDGKIVGISEAIYPTPELATQEGENFRQNYDRALRVSGSR